MTTCSRCILDSRIPDIRFDAEGECNYCKLHDKWNREYPLGLEGKRHLTQILAKVIKSSKRRRYDCVVGVSGGCDSSFLLYKTKEWGLHPLAVHWNNNWNTSLAETNIKRMVNKLNVDFFEVGVDREEYDDICKSFLLASVPDADIPNDIALTTVLYYAAERFKVKYILNAHSFRTEGTVPLGWSYMDGKYIQSIQENLGSHQLKTFPNLWLREWLRWIILSRLKRVRPLWYMDYQKEEAKRFLTKQFGWRWYGGHHLENKYTIFVSNYLQPKKFGIDLRYVEYSALIRSGQMTRDEALKKIYEIPKIDDAIIVEVKRRLNLTDEEFDEIMNAPKKTHHNYETYHPTFRWYRWFFWLTSKFNLVPKTFYVKYTG